MLLIQAVNYNSFITKAVIGYFSSLWVSSRREIPEHHHQLPVPARYIHRQFARLLH